MKSILCKKTILALVLALAVIFSCAVPTFATSDGFIFDEETTAVTEAPTEPSTQSPTEAPTESPTEESTENPSDAPTEVSTAPVQPSSTEPSTEEPATVTEPSTEPNTETTRGIIYIPTIRQPEYVDYPDVEQENDDDLPEGSFYVYLELNNSEPRLKKVFSEPTVIEKPNDPVREGYIFSGWYADDELAKPWDFSIDIVNEGTVLYAKWIADKNTVEYNITVVQSVGGTIKANPSKARAGEIITITAQPEDGKHLVFGSVTVNGKKIDLLSFKMPARDVVIEAAFEDVHIPTKEEKDYSKMFYVSLTVIVVLIAVSAFVLIRRKTIMNMRDSDFSDWTDSEVTLESGFKNGKKAANAIGDDNAEMQNDELDDSEMLDEISDADGDKSDE